MARDLHSDDGWPLVPGTVIMFYYPYDRGSSLDPEIELAGIGKSIERLKEIACKYVGITRREAVWRITGDLKADMPVKGLSIVLGLFRRQPGEQEAVYTGYDIHWSIG